MAGILNATWAGVQRYTFPYSGVNARWGASAQHIDVQPIQAPAMGSVSMLRNGMVYPSGLNSFGFGHFLAISKPNQYVQASCFLDATWQGAVAYQGSSTVVSGGWANVTYLYPAGMSEGLVGEHELRLAQQFITPDGFDALLPGDGYVLHFWEYAYPEWALDASWVGKVPYTPPEGLLGAAWRIPSEDLQVAVLGISEEMVGPATLELFTQYVYAVGAPEPEVRPPTVRLGAQGVATKGVDTSAFGRAFFDTGLRVVRLTSLVVSLRIGRPWISNWVQYVVPRGVESSVRFGQARLPFKQTVAPEGVDATSFGMLSVSPRYAYPIGWDSLVLDGEHLVSYAERRIFVESAKLSYGLGSFKVHSTVFPQWVVDVSFYASLYGRAGAVNKNHTVYPDGLGPPRFPTHALDEVNIPSYIYTQGISTHLVPVAKAYQAYQFIGSKYLGDPSPSAGVINLNKYGLAHVELGLRFILAPAISSTALVSNKLTIRDRTFYTNTIHANAGELFGKTDFSHEIRYIRTGGINSAAYGRARFVLEKYSVYVPYIFAFAAGRHVIGDGVRSIRAGGLDASESVGARMRVEFFRRAHRLEGWASSKIPVYHTIKDAVQYIRAGSLPVSDPSPGTFVENARRYLQPHEYRPSGVDPAGYGRAFVLDGNVYLRPSSINTWRIGVGVTLHTFYGDVSTVGVSWGGSFPRPIITHWLQPVLPAQWESSNVSRLGVVYNAAFAVKPEGIGAGVVNGVVVYNRNRSIRAISIADIEAKLGRSFVAARVRLLEAFSVRGGSYIPQEAWVSLYTRHIKPLGYFDNTMSTRWETEVFERFNIVKPYWNNQQQVQVGGAQVVHRNKTVRPYGYDYFESGVLSTELFIRTLEVIGAPQTVFGRTLIKDRRLFVVLQGYSTKAPDLSRFNTIRNLMPDPPSTRTIEVGEYEYAPRFGRVLVEDCVIYIRSIYAPTGIPSPVLTRNTITPDFGIHDPWQIGGGLAVSGPQYIEGITVHGVVLEPAFYGLPRMSPFTIYGPEGEEQPLGYTPEAPVGRHVVDFFIPPLFGRRRDKNGSWWIPAPRVDHRDRIMFPRPIAPPWPDLSGSRLNEVRYAVPPKETRYIEVRGVQSLRVGWVELSPFAKYIFTLGSSYAVFGEGVQVVEVPAYIRYVHVAGVASFSTGVGVVDYLNRYLFAKGSDVSSYGRPIVWFAKRYVAPSGVGSKLLVSNNAWVSNKIRYLQAMGFDALDPEEALLTLPTSVRNRYQGGVLSAKGFESGSLGAVDVGLYVRYVSARGMFATPLNRVCVKTKLLIIADGFDSLCFGAVRKYEEGVIQVHEFARAAVSVPVVSTPRQVQGFVSSVVDYPVIAAHIGPQGIESEGTGATVFKNEICCGDC